MDFLKTNLMWVVMAAVSGGMLLWPLIRSRTAGPSVSPLEATLLINREDALVLDVREPAEWSKGHIPNARHIPLGQIEKRLGELDKFKSKPIIVSCASGNRSSSVCGTLRKAGFEKVFNLAGGIPAWEQAGQPVTTR
ncbi:MAG: rhodanese-like domain-containing protein [Rhodocyclaceae bacterium]|jgi:rhodanese-related sulfurtransferase|nr:MAG: rhodanese-like domain-containing protein [Rhodocyclaceae bacterium]